MFRRGYALLALAALVTTTALACFDFSETPPSCQEILNECGIVDDGNGPLHACLTFAEDTDEESTCNEKKLSCVAPCHAAFYKREEERLSCEAILKACDSVEAPGARVSECAAVARAEKVEACVKERKDCTKICLAAAINPNVPPSCTIFVEKCRSLVEDNPDAGSTIRDCLAFAEQAKTDTECDTKTEECAFACLAGVNP